MNYCFKREKEAFTERTIKHISKVKYKIQPLKYTLLKQNR